MSPISTSAISGVMDRYLPIIRVANAELVWRVFLSSEFEIEVDMVLAPQDTEHITADTSTAVAGVKYRIGILRPVTLNSESYGRWDNWRR